mgnify:CR=1 FL=1
MKQEIKQDIEDIKQEEISNENLKKIHKILKKATKEEMNKILKYFELIDTINPEKRRYITEEE